MFLILKVEELNLRVAGRNMRISHSYHHITLVQIPQAHDEGMGIVGYLDRSWTLQRPVVHLSAAAPKFLCLLWTAQTDFGAHFVVDSDHVRQHILYKTSAYT